MLLHLHGLGFAGFFGLPAEYLPMGSEKARPQLPGLLAPALRVTDEGVTDDLRERRGLRMRFSGAWKSFKTNAVSGFSFVEATGLFYGPKPNQAWSCIGSTNRSFDS